MLHYQHLDGVLTGPDRIRLTLDSLNENPKSRFGRITLRGGGWPSFDYSLALTLETCSKALTVQDLMIIETVGLLIGWRLFWGGFY